MAELSFIDFTRGPGIDHEHVECIVDLGGVELHLWSEAPTGYREWEVEEAIIGYGGPEPMYFEPTRRAGRCLPHGELRTQIDREFTDWLKGEGRQPPPSNAMAIEEAHDAR